MNAPSSIFGHVLPKMRKRQERLWTSAAASTGLPPLDCKAIYVAGLIRHLVESAGNCFGAKLHIAAYQLAASTFETIGTATERRKAGVTENLASGLRYALGLAATASRDEVVATTDTGTHTIRECIKRRGFTAHGSSHLQTPIGLDADLTAALLELSLVGADRWWSSLHDGSGLDALAHARITPLLTSAQVIFVGDLQAALSDKRGTPGGEVLHQEHWRDGRSS